MTNKLVSIIMNCHNGEKYLPEAIESILNQTYKNWELIFWDNLSNDNSFNILNSYNDKRIKYFRSEEFTNLGKARRSAYRNCAGEYVAFLDTDDIWYPTKLEKQVSHFVDNIGIVTCNTNFFNDKISKPLYQHGVQDGKIFKNLLKNYNLSLETLIIRKKFAKDSNIEFDPQLSYISDFDFFLRLSKICEVKYVPEILSGWRVHKESESWKNPNKFNLEKKIFIKKIEKNYPRIIENYEHLWIKFKLQTLLKNCVHFIINKEAKKARKEIRENFVLSFKLIIIYFLSFFPFTKKLFIFLLGIRKKVKPESNE